MWDILNFCRPLVSSSIMSCRPAVVKIMSLEKQSRETMVSKALLINGIRKFVRYAYRVAIGVVQVSSY